MKHLADSLFQHSMLGVAFIAMDGSLLRINNTMCSILGYSREEMLYNNFFNLKLSDKTVDLLEGNVKFLTSEEHYTHKSGHILRVFQWVYLVRSDTNQPQYYIIHIEDITGHKTFSNGVIRKELTEEFPFESEIKYQRLMKHLPEPIVIHQEGIILYVNNATVKLIKAETDAEIIGKSVFDFLQEEHHKEVIDSINNLTNTEEASDFHRRSIYNVAGGLIETEISSIRIDSANHKPIILSVIRDITERQQAEEILISSEKLSVIGQLAAGVAHEIRNPLTALMGFTQLLKSKFTDSETYYFDIMQQELDRINQIVNEFMALAKPSMHEFRNGNLVGILQSVISILETQAIMTNVSIIKNYMDDVPVILCDENQLKQVFLNIIKNAIEAMPNGGKVTITIRITDAECLLIQIKDQGSGMPEDIIKKIGEPFFTTKEKGTGLGLMISRRIIEAHNGVLYIYSTQGKGTTVDVFLRNISQVTIGDI